MGEAFIELKNVSKRYGEGTNTVQVLRQVTLQVQAGEFVSIVGPSGSGKSTLLNILGLMDRPDTGVFNLNGNTVTTITDDERSKLRNEKIGFVFQFDSLLPEFTIAENVLMPANIAHARGIKAKADSNERMLSLLESLGISKLSGRFPSQTSGGERQRAAIARALINSPSIILADEPTGNLDRENGAKVFADLKRLARDQNVAVVLVTHDENAAKSADRMLRMGDGQLI